MTWQVVHRDCIAEMRELDDACIDSVVTDPPYELGFMGKKWDASGIAYSVAMWREVLRVLKPGGHLLSFGGTRTYHRMACAIEDAGFEVRDSLHWMYGSGFPKSLDVSKAIDKDEGFWRGRAGAVVSANPAMSGGNYERTPKGDPITAAAAWRGWGTALKPAHEPIVLARKRLIGTVAANVLAHGTGAINVDACRIGTEQGGWGGGGSALYEGGLSRIGGEARPVSGRWPANVLLDEEAAAELDAQSGTSKSPAPYVQQCETIGMYGAEKHHDRLSTHHGDSGGASRFFYVAKASRREREAGCEHLPAKTGAEAVDREEGSAGVNNPRAGAGRTASVVRNDHPTVKPIQLMRYLVRLITPLGGVVLDPFAGSGTTGCAAVLEGFDFYGVEQDAHHVDICNARIAHWAKQKKA